MTAVDNRNTQVTLPGSVLLAFVAALLVAGGRSWLTGESFADVFAMIMTTLIPLAIVAPVVVAGQRRRARTEATAARVAAVEEAVQETLALLEVRVAHYVSSGSNVALALTAARADVAAYRNHTLPVDTRLRWTEQVMARRASDAAARHHP